MQVDLFEIIFLCCQIKEGIYKMLLSFSDTLPVIFQTAQQRPAQKYIKSFAHPSSLLLGVKKYEIWRRFSTPVVFEWRDALETVIIRRKLTDAQANPSTQRKR